jgi:hypothetical protein
MGNKKDPSYNLQPTRKLENPKCDLHVTENFQLRSTCNLESLSCDPHVGRKVSVATHRQLSVATNIQLVKSSCDPHVIRKVVSSNKQLVATNMHLKKFQLRSACNWQKNQL